MTRDHRSKAFRTRLRVKVIMATLRTFENMAYPNILMIAIIVDKLAPFARNGMSRGDFNNIMIRYGSLRAQSPDVVVRSNRV